MNDTDIERLLRKAPRPTPPPELEPRLLEDIVLTSPSREPETEFALPWIRRWFPALSFGVLLLGCFVAVGLQTAQFLELRQERDRLLSVEAGLEALQAEHAELKGRRTELERVWRDHEDYLDLVALRKEAAQLREHAEVIKQLQAERDRLQTALDAAIANAVVAGQESDTFAEAEARAKRIQCVSNLKQIGLAARMWQQDQGPNFPNDFIAMTNELANPKLLTCPADEHRVPAPNWEAFSGASISYEMLSAGAPITDPEIVYTRCPIHNNVGFVDGSVQQLAPDREFVTTNGITRLLPPR